MLRGSSRINHVSLLDGFNRSSIAAFSQQDGATLNTADQNDPPHYPQLTALARDAYYEMIEDIEARGDIPANRQAFTMTALLVGNTVYFSSAIKGGSFVYLTPGGGQVNPNLAEQVRLGIERCQTQYGAGRWSHFQQRCFLSCVAAFLSIHQDQSFADFMYSPCK